MMKIGIRAKVAGLMLGIAVGVAALSGVILWSHAHARRMGQLESEAEAYAAVARGNLKRLLQRAAESDPLLDSQIASVVSELAELEHIQWIEVFDRDLRVVAHSAPQAPEEAPMPEQAAYVRRVVDTGETLQAITPDEGRILLYFPVSAGGGNAAPSRVIALAMTTAGVESDLRHRFLGSFYMFALLLAAISVTLFIALDALVLRPMHRLAAAVRETSTGKLDLSDLRDRRDELGAISGKIAEAFAAREKTFRSIADEEVESRYRSFIEAVPHGISKVDVSGRIVYCNVANAAMYGYSQSEMIGKHVWELLAHEGDREANRSDWPRIVREQPKPKTFHGRGRTKEGGEIDIQVDWTYDRDVNGILTGLICVVTDVTEGSRAHAKLRESEERYRLLVQASPYCIEEIDLDGRLRSMNRAGMEMFRIADESAVGGTTYWELVCDADRERVRRCFESAKRGSAEEFEFCAGDGRTMHSSFVPVRNGSEDVARVMGISMDVTETKKAREELERSEARFKEIVEEMPVMMDAFDEEGHVVMWNRECERVTGYTAEEMVGNPEAMSLLYPDDAIRSRKLREWSERGDDYRDWEWELSCKDGSTRVVSWSNVSQRFPIPGWSSWSIGIDVTDRRRAERALKESEGTLRSITESSPDILLVVELDGTIRFINRTLERPREKVIGTSIFDYVSEPFKARLHDCFDRVRETRRLDSVIMEYESVKGKVLFFQARVGPILQGNDASAFVVAARDVTEMREAEARFRAQYEHSPLPTYTWRHEDGDFVLESANDAGFSATGGNVGKLIGKSASEIYHDEPEILDDFARCHRTGKPIRRELRYKFRTTGEEREMEVTYAFVPPDVVMLHADDITERKAAQEALERSEESLAEAQRIAHLGNWDWDIGTDELLWSDETYRIFGLEPGEFGATYEAFLETVHPEDRDRVMKAVADALERREPYSLDHRILRREGDERIVHEEGEVTFGASGKPIRMVGTVQDVTEQRIAEVKLTSALAEKETLLREIHHRVKNNLQIISSLLYLQAQKCHDHAIIRMLDEMERRVKTMALIHENLYQSPDLNRVDFQSYLHSLASGLLSAHHGLPVSIETDVENAFLTIETAVPCGLIVNELVTNAVRHAFRAQKGRIRIGFTKSNDDCMLSVEDDGIGLPDDIDVRRSSSLGLRLVSGLTEQIRGHIDVERGGGTRFTIRFSA